MKKILLIEDNPDVRENTAEILELAGYTVTSASNGKEGIESVGKEIPDLIICDIMMPELDGYEVLHLLSKQSNTAPIPFIFLTAKSERLDQRKGMEMGADDYITKPFEKMELLKAVERRLDKAELLKKHYQSNLSGLNEFMHDFGSDQLLKKYTEGKKVNTFRKKETIYSEGNYPSGIYFINQGKIKIAKQHKDGKELIIDILQPNDFFGYTYLLAGMPYGESAQALEDSELTYIPGEDFFDLIYNNRSVSKTFLGILTKNVTMNHDQLLDIAYSSVRKRVAEALLSLKDKFNEENKPVGLGISRENMASIVGTATESLIRTLSDFKSEGLISITEGKIFIENEEKLRRMKN